MFNVEILHKYAPDEARRHAAKVVDNTAEHLTYAEREILTGVLERLEEAGNTAGALSMQHVGPLGDMLDLASTIGSAGEALCQFALHRALMNPHELAAVKTGIGECSAAVIEALDAYADEATREAAAEKFMDWAPDRFVPLFEDLEAHAQRKFPHLAANG